MRPNLPDDACFTVSRYLSTDHEHDRCKFYHGEVMRARLPFQMKTFQRSMNHSMAFSSMLLWLASDRLSSDRLLVCHGGNSVIRALSSGHNIAELP
jgi:hypothetical protein